VFITVNVRFVACVTRYSRAQKIGVVRNTIYSIQVLLQSSSHCQKLSKSAEDRQSYCKNKKGAVFLKHSVFIKGIYADNKISSHT